MKLPRGDSNKENSLITSRMTTKKSDNCLTISSQNEFSREHESCTSTNEFDFINAKTGTFLTLGTSLCSKATFAGHSWNTNQNPTFRRKRPHMPKVPPYLIMAMIGATGWKSSLAQCCLYAQSLKCQFNFPRESRRNFMCLYMRFGTPTMQFQVVARVWRKA